MKTFVKSCLVFLALVTHCLSAELEDGWKNVDIGGGGYVTDLYAHPKKGETLYIRTDNGGAFQWNREKKQWIALTEHFTLAEKNQYGIESLALDPKNESNILIATGTFIGQKGHIYVSNDKGKTWKKSNFTGFMGSNEPKRWAGNRLAFSPHNSKIAFFGSRKDGLWKSENGGNSWNKISSLPTPSNEIGILNIAFSRNKKNTVYSSVFGDGIYQSNDEGKSWKKMQGSPKETMKIAISKKGTLYVTSSSEQRVVKYTGGKWQNITPPGMENVPFNGISINPFNQNNIITSPAEDGNKGIYISTNGGKSWNKKGQTLKKTVPWWPDSFFNNNSSSLNFDPKIKNRAYVTDWFGIWKTDNINAETPTWENFSKGHEQLVMFDILTPRKGPQLISAAADVEGFIHDDIDKFPKKRMGIGAAKDEFIDFLQETYGLASDYKEKETLARVGGWRWRKINHVAISDDSGNTWQVLNAYPQEKIPQEIAVSYNNISNMVVTIAEQSPLYTTDKGKSWNMVSGLPNGVGDSWNWDFKLAADGKTPGLFYYYSDGTFYRSADNGKSFKPSASNLPKAETAYVQTFPGLSGEVWVALGKGGLHKSREGGFNFKKIDSVGNCILFTKGMPLKGNKGATLYMYGTPSSGARTEGAYYSTDNAKTWKKITTSKVTVGMAPKVMRASNQEPGLIFIATLGRSVYYYKIKNN